MIPPFLLTIIIVITVYLVLNFIYSQLLTLWIARQMERKVYRGVPAFLKWLDRFMIIKTRDALKDAGLFVTFDVRERPDEEGEDEI